LPFVKKSILEQLQNKIIKDISPIVSLEKEEEDNPVSTDVHQNNVKEGHKNRQSYANTRVTGKEQYYTTPEVVDICLKEVQKHIDLKDRIVLEPAGGTGEFIEGFRRIGIKDENIVSYDIQPKHDMVMEGNFLNVKSFPSDKMISITNPPFGRMSSLAVEFFKHSEAHCDYICYLIPKSWRKWSMLNRLPENFHLISDIDLPKDCFYIPEEDKTEKEKQQGLLETVFQIWEKRDELRKKIDVEDHGFLKKITPILVDQNGQKLLKVKKDVLKELIKEGKAKWVVRGANFSMVVFGHSCGKKFEDITLPEVDRVTTTMYFYIEKQEVKDALREIDFSEFANNVAYIKALSIDEINYKLNEKFGLKKLK
jgi:hypothetical protein